MILWDFIFELDEFVIQFIISSSSPISWADYHSNSSFRLFVLRRMLDQIVLVLDLVILQSACWD